MYRTIINQLVSWKDSSTRKPLILTGVRQCGKTFVLQEFGKFYFEQVAYFNFEQSQALSSIFDFDYNVQRILMELCAAAGLKNIISGTTLVIFDEIQACPKAITSLKYFCEDMPDLHLVCAGSLLGVAINHANISFPVGKVERMNMYPMSFKEFIIANGLENIVKVVENFELSREIPEIYSVPLTKALKNYFIVGGMPEAVKQWVNTHSYDEVEKIQDNILADYSSDFAKYAPTSDIPKLGWIWDSVPQQLAKENNKFVFSHVRKGKRSAELEDALKWLENAGLIYRLELVENAEMPLSFYANATHFKVYMCDVGLLRRKSGVSAKTILEENDLFTSFKGAFTENYVMMELNQLAFKSFFWRSGNKAELDFLIEYNDAIIPIEAKAELNTKAKSYKLFCKRYNSKMGFKFSMKNIGDNIVEQAKTYSLPLYIIWKLKKYL